MNARCAVFSRFVVAGTLTVLVYLIIDYVISCVQCVLLIDGRCSDNVHWYCEYEMAPTLFRRVSYFAHCLNLDVQVIQTLGRNATELFVTSRELPENSGIYFNKGISL